MCIIALYTRCSLTQDGDMSKMQDPTGALTMPPKLEQGSDTERIQIVAPSSWIERLDDWRRAQKKIPNRSDAIRQIVDFGLEQMGKGKRGK